MTVCRAGHRLAYFGAVCAVCTGAVGIAHGLDDGPKPPPVTWRISAPVAVSSSSQDAATRPTVYTGLLGTVTLRVPQP